MPRSIDPLALRQLPAEHNPLNRIDPHPRIKPFDLAEAILQWQHTFENFLLPAIHQVTGLDLATPQGLVDSIIHLLEGAVANIGEVVSVIAHALGAPNPIGITLEHLSEWVLDTIFGLIPPDRIPILPIGHLINDAVNLLSNPSFTGVAIQADMAGQWVLDAAVSHDGVGGSARIDAAGTAHDLLSVDLIPVWPGQEFDLSAWVKTANLIGPAGCVTIGVVTYPNADGTGTPAYRPLRNVQTGTQDWTKWHAAYIVPAFEVASLRVHLSVKATATAGQVWFDDLFLGKRGLLQIDWVADLGVQLGSIWNQLAEMLHIPEIVTHIEDVTGLDLSHGPIAFLNSLIAALFAHTGIHLQTPAELVAGIEGLFGIPPELQALLNGVLEAFGIRPTTAAPLATTNDAADQIALLVATVTAQSTTIAQLQAAVHGPTGGLVSGDDFERVDPDGVGDALWMVVNSGLGGGGFFCDGHEAVWRKQPGLLALPRTAHLVRINPADRHTKTPYQAITRVTGTRVKQSMTSADTAADLILGRVSDDGAQYVIAWVDAAGVHLGYNVGSGERSLASRTAPSVAAAATYTLECGNATEDLVYRVLRNGAVFIDFLDDAKVTAPLMANLGWGWGGAANGSLTGQLAPSSLHSITVADLRSP